MTRGLIERLVTICDVPGEAFSTMAIAAAMLVNGILGRALRLFSPLATVIVVALDGNLGRGVRKRSTMPFDFSEFGSQPGEVRRCRVNQFGGIIGFEKRHGVLLLCRL